MTRGVDEDFFIGMGKEAIIYVLYKIDYGGSRSPLPPPHAASANASYTPLNHRVSFNARQPDCLYGTDSSGMGNYRIFFSLKTHFSVFNVSFKI
jgi:hypothetical protein